MKSRFPTLFRRAAPFRRLPHVKLRCFNECVTTYLGEKEVAEQRFKPVPWTKLTRGVPCYLPKPADPASVQIHSPAIEVMTDFRRALPVTIAPNASLDEANKLMARYSTQLLLVAGEHGHLLGIATNSGTQGNRPLAVAHQRNVRVNELLVADVMIDKHDEAEVMHLRDVLNARVGNVLATLKALGTTYCLVVDHDEAEHHVLCGVFSLPRIERLIGLDPQTEEVAHTFSQVVSSLRR